MGCATCETGARPVWTVNFEEVQTVDFGGVHCRQSTLKGFRHTRLHFNESAGAWECGSYVITTTSAGARVRASTRSRGSRLVVPESQPAHPASARQHRA
eukprot:3039672-Rhodomonas_salina.1